MNGEIPSVPITTLAGVSSLVDLLPEMPLPTPLPQTLSNKSLLFHPRVAEEAQRLLSINDDNLIPQLIQSLCMTSSKHIDLKDQQYNEMPLDHPNAPRLLAGILHRKPDVFKGKNVAENMTDWSHNSQNQTQVNVNSQQASSSQSHIYGNMNNISGTTSNPHQLVSHQQHNVPILAGSSTTTSMSDLHHQHQMNNDSLQMMQQSLDFISGLQSEQPSSSNSKNAQDGSGHHGLPMYNSRSSSTAATAGIGNTNNSPFGLSIPQLGASYSPQHGGHLNLNHHHGQPHHSQSPVQSHSSKTAASSSSSSSSSLHLQQYNQSIPMSPPKSNHAAAYGSSSTNMNLGGRPHLPPSHLSNNNVLVGSDPTNTNTNISQIPHHSRNTSGGGSSSVSGSANFSQSHLNNINVPVPQLSHQTTQPPPPPIQQLHHHHHNNNNSVNVTTTLDNILGIGGNSGSVAKIAMNVPMLKIDNNMVNHTSSMSSTSSSVQNQKELVIKLERSNDPQVQQALNKFERKDSTDSVTITGETTTTTTPTRSGRKGSTNNSSKSQNYREIDSEEDEQDGGDDDDNDGSSPSKGSGGRKGKIFKSKDNVKDKRKKRESKDSDYTGETMQQSTSSDTKKRRLSSIPVEPQETEEPKKKVRRVERMLIPVLEKLGAGIKIGGNIMDNSTYHRFLKTMDIVLESIDYADKSEIDTDEDGNVSSEFLISKSQINELCSEAAKLKALGAMEAMPTEKIVRLLTLLEINIRDGCKVTPLADPEDNDEESKLWLELTMESISRGVIACLTSLHILTSPNMPKRAYQEDLIDRIVIFSKFQLQNTVFPTFDPVYRVRGKGDLGSSNKKKRAHAREVREKAMLTFYTKMHEVVSLLAELLNVQVLTDTTVLHLSTLGVSPFFVENVSELQLSALKLVTGIFTHYDKHRRLLLDDILASIARLPSSKRSLRTFKLSAGSDENIQMLTALVLQLIQCVTHLPSKLNSKKKIGPDGEIISEKQNNTDIDILISGRFDTAVRTAGNFLAVFLNKCGSKSEDCDYRVLFENFIQDLLSTVNKPEWPASELLLSLLGNLLVKNLGNKGLEVSMRVASLEYLGVAAARLRKDAVSAQKKLETIDRIIADIRAEDDSYRDGGNNTKDGSTFDLNNEEDKVEFLQRLLLDYLAVNGQSDPALMQSRHFYISSWWKSAQNDISKSIQSGGSGKAITKKNKKKKKKTTSSGEDESDDFNESDDDEEQEDEQINKPELNTKLLQLVERRRNFLLTKVRPFTDPLMTSRKTEVVQTFVDYHSAELLTRYLASKRPFSASFDFFLTRILSVSTESTVAIRTKALRCLTMVVEADPGVLARHDMQLWVQNSFLDQSTAVREAAVDLVGKYVLSCPDLIEKYYDILSLRILDTGVSVRKRVIKILREICVEHPTFVKIPEICVKMIRRVNDEDGIRKLVMEVFQSMWFSPVKEEPQLLDTKSLLRKVSNITEVVASCEKVGLDFFEQLLLSLFKPKEEQKDDIREKVVNPEPPKIVLTASRQIVNCLVEHVLCLEQASEQTASSQRFVACVATLYLFAKIRPQLLVNHAITLEGYLSLRTQNSAEVQAIANIASILELVVPLLVNPADSFLSQLEEDCVKLIFKNDKGVIESCLACLGAVINKITHNYALVRDVFRRFQTILFSYSKFVRDGELTDPKLNEARPRLRRAIYTIGMCLRYFDFMHHDVYGDLPASTVNLIFSELMYLIDQPDVDLQIFSLQAVGNLCIRHYDFMLGDELKRVYQSLLTSSAEIRLKTQALFNIQLYLTEEELRMIKQDQEWTKNAKMQDIKEMGDVTSGMASTIVQIYLKQILEAFLHRDITVRLAAVRVIQLVLQQGLVHPIQIVPYLICMSTDAEPGVSTTADKQLQEMEKKHPQFLQSQVLNGIKLSLQLQRILAGYNGSITNHLIGFHGHNSSSSEHLNSSFLDENNPLPLVRGYRIRPKEQPSALNGFLYSLLRSTKPQRRAIARSLLQQFDDQNKTRLADLLYYCDNLAYFPYQVIDEPLFIIHHVDIVISVTGSNLLQSFKESLIPLHPPQPQTQIPNQNQLQQFQQPPVMHLIDDEDGPLPGEILPCFENGDGILNPEFDLGVGNINVSMGGIPLQPLPPPPDDDDDDDDIEALLKRIPDDTRNLEDCITGAQGVLLLLMLKQHLKETYGINDAKISSYSPSDASKIFERPVNRKNAHVFEPKCTLANLQCPPCGYTPEGRKALVEQYIHFKQLMLRIDPEEGDEDGETVKPVKLKIDQNLFTYSNAKGVAINSTPGSINDVSTNQMAAGHGHRGSVNYNNSNSNYGVAPQYPVTPVKQVVEPVRIPKLKIVPLAFPGGNDGSHSQHKSKSYKVSSKDKEHHHHHHKHKKSKHKKKKRSHAISDDSDSDNSDDPDFRI